MRRALKLLSFLLGLGLLCACGLAGAVPGGATLPPLTRVVSAQTFTPSPTVPSPTPTATRPTATPSPSPSPTPSLTPTASPTAPFVRLMAVGDVMLGNWVGQQIEAQGAALPFAGVQPVLSEADLLVANLECAISAFGEPQPKAYRFRAPYAAADALTLAGVDVVSLANNHAFDYGPVAFNDMRQQLAQRDLAAVGAGANDAQAHAPVFLERNGLRLAFLAYVHVLVESRTSFDTSTWTAGRNTPGVAWAEPARITADVRAAKKQADVVIVLLHSGLEGRTAVADFQRAEAHAAIDAGAALVLGAHPHVLQPTERYGNGLIVYSLGNFIFPGFTLPETYSAIFSAAITAEGVRDFTWIPLVVDDKTGFPRLAETNEAVEVLKLVQP